MLPNPLKQWDMTKVKEALTEERADCWACHVLTVNGTKSIFRVQGHLVFHNRGQYTERYFTGVHPHRTLSTVLVQEQNQCFNSWNRFTLYFRNSNWISSLCATTYRKKHTSFFLFAKWTPVAHLSICETMISFQLWNLNTYSLPELHLTQNFPPGIISQRISPQSIIFQSLSQTQKLLQFKCLAPAFNGLRFRHLP